MEEGRRRKKEADKLHELVICEIVHLMHKEIFLQSSVHTFGPRRLLRRKPIYNPGVFFKPAGLPILSKLLSPLPVVILTGGLSQIVLVHS